MDKKNIDKPEKWDSESFAYLTLQSRAGYM